MVSVKEALQICGVSRQTIYNYIHNGEVAIDQKMPHEPGIIRLDKQTVLGVAQKKAEWRQKTRAKSPPGRCAIS